MDVKTIYISEWITKWRNLYELTRGLHCPRLRVQGQKAPKVLLLIGIIIHSIYIFNFIMPCSIKHVYDE